jgi:hypothetical protein
VTDVNAKRIGEGVELIVIGGILLANTVGALPWSIWLSIFSLWPIWLVAAGIDLIGKSTDRAWVRVLASLVMIAALLYGALAMAPGAWRFPLIVNSGVGGQRVDQTEPHSSGIDTGTVRLGVGATDLSVGPGADLAKLGGESPAGLEPRLSATTSGNSAIVTLDYRRGSTIWIPGSITNRLFLELDETVRWTRLELDAGAARADLDLRNIMVDEVAMNIGAADARVLFAERRDCKAIIKGGVANVTLVVPKSSDVTLSTQGVLNTDVPDDFARSGGWGDRTWTHKGGGAAIDISVEGGIANVKVETY